jgi:hypothetical protein
MITTMALTISIRPPPKTQRRREEARRRERQREWWLVIWSPSATGGDSGACEERGNHGGGRGGGRLPLTPATTMATLWSKTARPLTRRGGLATNVVDNRRRPSRMDRATPMTISGMMPPPSFFPTASELTGTTIDPRGGHLTINKGGRWRRNLGRGGRNGRVTPERRCRHMRMRT